MEVSGNSALIKGDYKLTRNTPPHGDNIWRLYNLAVDPGESHDLRAQQPQRYNQMMADYSLYETEFGVIPPAEDFDYIAQTRSNAIEKILQRNRLRLALTAVIVLLLIGLIIRYVYRRQQAQR